MPAAAFRGWAGAERLRTLKGVRGRGDLAVSLWITVLMGVVAVAAVGWLGLRMRPRPFAAYDAPTEDRGFVRMPEGLPAPVERYFRTVYGDEIPVIDSAVISGRARLRLFGVVFPGRFRFVHVAGWDYRHYIEATIFGLPLMRVNEFYVDGNSRLELPFGVTEGEPNILQAANLGLWGESFWFPAILLTDPRVHWAPVDDEAALLYVPYGEQQQSFLVRFDRGRGLVRLIEAMRYKDENSPEKTLWLNEVTKWDVIDGTLIPQAIEIMWHNEGRPWAEFQVEEVVYNADVTEYVRLRGL